MFKKDGKKFVTGRLNGAKVNNDDIEKWIKLYGKFDIGTIKELLKDEGVAVLRLTPEITDDSRGFDSLLTTMKKNFDLISFPFIGDANSYFI